MNEQSFILTTQTLVGPSQYYHNRQKVKKQSNNNENYKEILIYTPKVSKMFKKLREKKFVELSR